MMAKESGQCFFHQISKKYGFFRDFLKYFIIIIPVLTLISGCVATRGASQTNQIRTPAGNEAAPGLINYPRGVTDTKTSAKVKANSSESEEDEMGAVETIATGVFLIGALLFSVWDSSGDSYEDKMARESDVRRACSNLGVTAPDSCP